MGNADVETIADAIKPSAGNREMSRRTVAKGAAWSVPAISLAIAAPANAVSPGICEQCDPNTGRPPQCLISTSPGGTCSCPENFLCVGTGPLGLANFCIAPDLIGVGSTTCGSTTCFGVCLGTGGAAINLVNTLAAAITAFASTVGAVLPIARVCVNQPGVPKDICASPFSDGSLGTLCTYTSSCGGNIAIDLALRTVTGIYNSTITGLSNLGIAVSPKCQTGLVCRDIASVAVDVDVPLIDLGDFAFQMGIGFCACPDGTKTCGPSDPTPFGGSSGFQACTPR